MAGISGLSVFSVLTLIFRHYILNEPISPMFAIKSILNFTSFMYGWYIEMWIGLFLLVPFLNILYKGIPTKAHKHVLIITLSFLTFIPVFTNRYGQHLLPAFWTSLYPMAFYFIGSYIREYQPSVSKWCAAGIILAIGLVPGIFTMIATPGHSLVRILGDCTGVFGALSAIMLFVVLYKMVSHDNTVSRIVYWISLLSLDMYLCCYIFDAMVYPWFKQRYFIDQSSFGIYFFIIVPIIFLCAFLLSLVKRMLFSVSGAVRFR